MEAGSDSSVLPAAHTAPRSGAKEKKTRRRRGENDGGDCSLDIIKAVGNPDCGQRGPRALGTAKLLPLP